MHVALEACTGWLFVSRALERAGGIPHLAEPVETSALRGRKRRAKTDREDARWLRTLLGEGRLPESWIPPEHVREWRSRARLRKTLIDERTQWLQRVQATLFHHGISGASPPSCAAPPAASSWRSSSCPLTRASGSRSRLQMIDSLDGQLARWRPGCANLARRQAGCRALMAQFGMARADLAD